MSAHAHENEPHVEPVSLYLKIYGALLVLTVFTVLVSTSSGIGDYSHALSLFVAMVIATMKGSLVLLFFMHVLHDDKLIGLIVTISLFFMALFFSMTMYDASSRDVMDWREETQAFRELNGLGVVNDTVDHHGEEHGEEHAEAEHAEAAEHGDQPAAEEASADEAH